MLAWAAVDLGDETQAEGLLQQALQRAQTHHLRFCLVDPLRILARLCLRRKRWEEAQAALEEALMLCRAMPYPYAEAKALAVSGLLYQAKGEPDSHRSGWRQRGRSWRNWASDSTPDSCSDDGVRQWAVPHCRKSASRQHN
jgi:uncharacterized protein HemY